MPNAITSYLDVLPVELLYYILNFLDTNTILLSLRFVCKRFYNVSNAYDQYKLNLSSCKKYDFFRFCRIINPLHVISLVLSNDDRTPGQVSLFLSFFNFKQFNYLYSLTLLDIDDTNLHIILKNLSCLLLKSLTIKSRALITSTDETLLSLSTILEQSSLKELNLSIWRFEIYEFIWPDRCYVEYLQISNRITFEQYCTILEKCSYLRTLIIKDVLWNDADIPNSMCYKQLTSLTLDDNRMDVFKLEQFFSLTPSLTYLKVVGMAYLIDSYLWETILQSKLPNLVQFEFFFISWDNVNYNFSDIETLIQPFQTEFWLEKKHWIVNCDYVINPTEVMLYSIPICKPYFQYHSQVNKISCSNSTKFSISQAMMNTVSKLRVNLIKTLVHDDFLLKNESSDLPLFHNVTSLTYDLNYKCPDGLAEPLFNLVNLSSIKQLSLNINYDLAFDSNTTVNLINTIASTNNINSFEVYNNLSLMSSNTTIEDICLLIPTSIEHLKITVKNIYEMKTVFDQFKHLSSITFMFSFDSSIPSPKIIESFLNIKRDLTYQKDDCSIRVWLNQPV